MDPKHASNSTKRFMQLVNNYFKISVLLLYMYTCFEDLGKILGKSFKKLIKKNVLSFKIF